MRGIRGLTAPADALGTRPRYAARRATGPHFPAVPWRDAIGASRGCRSNPKLRGHRSALPATGLSQRSPREAAHGRPTGRGSDVVRGRAVSGLVRHPERSHAAGRNRRLGLGVPTAGDEHQRPHGGPAGPARVVRAPRPLRLAHRARQSSHGAGFPDRGQAPELAERRGREV